MTQVFKEYISNVEIQFIENYARFSSYGREILEYLDYYKVGIENIADDNSIVGLLSWYYEPEKDRRPKKKFIEKLNASWLKSDQKGTRYYYEFNV